MSATMTMPVSDLDMAASPIGEVASRGRAAQVRWAATSFSERLRVVRKARHLIAAQAQELAASIPGRARSRNLADTLVAEVLPLAEACRFLEREASAVLRPVKLGSRGRPVWLRGVESEIHRVPLGLVLLIAPSNYPLFLPGVQAMQALAAGNAVLWKPAAGGDQAARALARILATAGLPENVLQVLDTTIKTGVEAIHAGVDKVFLTGHADTGRAVMEELANPLTPSVMELSGCDAVFVLPGADLDRVAESLVFGLRLNGSATCMAPRRVFASAVLTRRLQSKLLPLLASIGVVSLSMRTRDVLDHLLSDAEQRGAVIVRDGRHADGAKPTIVSNAQPEHAIMRTDIFAPVLAFCSVEDDVAALRAHAQCPYALTAAIFGPELHANHFAARLRVGTVLINDLIVSTADPRVPFGGRGASGFGVTRGREGLLEMTAVKTILRQRSRSLRPYASTASRHEEFFAAFIQTVHGGSWKTRYQALCRLLRSARNLEK
jgi:aldehyde dehydrogenase (NAD+)